MEMDSRNQSMRAAGSALEDASSRAGAAAGRMSERAHQAVDQVASTVQGAAERFGAQSEEWMARQDEVMDQVREYVRERPLMSLAMAAALGFLLSRLAR